MLMEQAYLRFYLTVEGVKSVPIRGSKIWPRKAQIAGVGKKLFWAGRVPNPFPVAGPIRPVRRPVRYITLPNKTEGASSTRTRALPMAVISKF